MQTLMSLTLDLILAFFGRHVTRVLLILVLFSYLLALWIQVRLDLETLVDFRGLEILVFNLKWHGLSLEYLVDLSRG